MNFNLLSDKIVFNSLKLIKHGFLEIQNHDSKIYKFGNESEQLRAKIKINKPGLTLQIIKSGSVGLAEAYMRNEFETDNLTNLIEITAKNIKIVYKFSGIFDLSMINKFNKLKNFIRGVYLYSGEKAFREILKFYISEKKECFNYLSRICFRLC